MSGSQTYKWVCDRCQTLVYEQDRPQNWMPVKAHDLAGDIAIGNYVSTGPYGHFCSDCAYSFKQWLLEPKKAAK